MKSFNSVVAVLFLSAMFNQNSVSQTQQVWYNTSLSPVVNSAFNIYTGVDNDENVQFVVSGNATGVFRSTDVGANWVNIGLNGVTLTGFHDNPDNSGEYVVTASDGVYITTDGGTTWPQHNTGIEGLFITDVTQLDPSSPIGNNLCIGTVGQGVFTSSNGGQTWEQLGTGLENKTVTHLESFVLTSGPLLEVVLFATTQDEGVYGFDFSTNTWLPSNDGNPSLLNNTAIASNNQGEFFLTNFDFGVYSSPADPIFWQLEINFQYANDIIGTQDGEVYFSSLGNGVKVRDLNGNVTDFSSGLEKINGYIDVVNIALDRALISIIDRHLWAAVNPLEPGGTPGIYRTVNPITDVEDNSIVTPIDFKLEQNYPNPFNPSTTISYSIPNSSFVTIKVYDVLGNEIAQLVNEEKSVGVHEVTFNASNLSTGTYFYHLQAVSTSSNSGKNFVVTRKMILIK